jgi:hypothetical protein
VDCVHTSCLSKKIVVTPWEYHLRAV